MSNPRWTIGMKAVNPNGRPKKSVLTPEGILERLMLRYFTPNRVTKMLRTQSNTYQLNFYIDGNKILAASKTKIDNLSEAEINRLHDQIMEALEKQQHGKAV
jgi:hypothetical protein